MEDLKHLIREKELLLMQKKELEIRIEKLKIKIEEDGKKKNI